MVDQKHNPDDQSATRALPKSLRRLGTAANEERPKSWKRAHPNNYITQTNAEEKKNGNPTYQNTKSSWWTLAINKSTNRPKPTTNLNHRIVHKSGREMLIRIMCDFSTKSSHDFEKSNQTRTTQKILDEIWSLRALVYYIFGFFIANCYDVHIICTQKKKGSKRSWSKWYFPNCCYYNFGKWKWCFFLSKGKWKWLEHSMNGRIWGWWVVIIKLISSTTPCIVLFAWDWGKQSLSALK